MIDEVLLAANVSGLGRYFEMMPETESDYGPGQGPYKICEQCGRKSFPGGRKLNMLPSMWKGLPMFYLGGIGMTMVTDGLKRAIQAHRFTNVAFKARPE